MQTRTRWTVWQSLRTRIGSGKRLSPMEEREDIELTSKHPLDAVDLPWRARRWWQRQGAIRFRRCASFSVNLRTLRASLRVIRANLGIVRLQFSVSHAGFRHCGGLIGGEGGRCQVDVSLLSFERKSELPEYTYLVGVDLHPDPSSGPFGALPCSVRTNACLAESR